MTSNFVWIQPGDTISLAFLVDDETTGLYPQAKIYDSSDTLYTTINLTSPSTIDGLYTGDFTPGTSGYYYIIYIPYTDSGHTIVDTDHDKSTEVIFVKHLPQSSFAPVITSEGLTEKNLDVLKKLIPEAVWQYQFPNDRTAKEELIAKSEFDFKKDKILVAYDIAKDTKEIISSIAKVSSGIIKNLANEKDDKKVIDEFVKLSKLVKSNKLDISPLYNEINILKLGFDKIIQEIKDNKIDLSGLNELNDKLSNHSKMVLEAIKCIPEPEKMEMPDFKEIEDNIIKQISNIKIEKSKDYTIELKDLKNKIQTLENLKLLIDQLVNYVNSQNNNLLIVLDKIVGKLDKMDNDIKNSQLQIANLIVEKNASIRE